MTFDKVASLWKNFFAKLRILVKEANYSVKSNDRFVRDFLVLGMNSDSVWKDWFKVGNVPTFKEVCDMAKSEESADKQLQLMNTEVCSINVPKRYQCQGNQRPTSNTGSSKLQACRNCGSGVPTLESNAPWRMLHVTSARIKGRTLSKGTCMLIRVKEE